MAICQYQKIQSAKVPVLQNYSSWNVKHCLFSNESRSGVHHRAPVEESGASVGGFDLVADRVRQGSFSNLASGIGLLRRPVPE